MIKLSEAIRKGAQGRRQCVGSSFNEDYDLSKPSEITECCATGAALLGWILEGVITIDEAKRCVAHQHPPNGPEEDVMVPYDTWDTVISWNDNDRLTFDEIVRHLEIRGL